MATDSLPVEEQDDYVAEPVLRLGRRNREDDVEMDITPMIDVTFLLLIFFLVSSTMQQEEGLSLPDARAGSPISATNSAVLVLTKSDGDSITRSPVSRRRRRRLPPVSAWQRRSERPGTSPGSDLNRHTMNGPGTRLGAVFLGRAQTRPIPRSPRR